MYAINPAMAENAILDLKATCDTSRLDFESGSLTKLVASQRLTGGGCHAGHQENRSRCAAGRAPAQRQCIRVVVPKAKCGAKDRVETALQGQTSIADRQSGASEQAYNCNLELVGQYQRG